MKILKRSLALLIAVILLPLQQIWAESPAVQIDREMYYKNTLLGLEILSEEDAEKTAETPVTRWEFARMAAHLMTNEVPAANYLEGQIFGDVNRFNDGYDELYYLWAHDIIAGTDGGNFDPDATIRTEDAYAILLRILKYEPLVNEMGGYSVGYHSIAVRVGLSDENLGEDLTYAEVYPLLYRALQTPMLEGVIFGTDGSVTYRNSTPLLEYYQNIIYFEGVMTENRYTSLLAAKSVFDNRIMVDGISVQVPAGDYDAYLGTEVRAYCKETSDGQYELQYLVPTPNRTRYIELTQDSDFTCNGTQLTYYDDNGNRKNLTLSENLDIILNGVAYPEFANLESALVGVTDENGNSSGFDTLRLIDSTGDGTYEVAILIECQDVVTDMVNAEAKMFIDKRTGTVFDYDLPDMTVRIVKPDGTEGTFSDITADMIVSVADSHTDGVNFTTLYLSNNIISAAITVHNADGTCTINDTTYYLDDMLKKDVVLGQTQRIYINQFGRIVYIGAVSDGKYRIGILAGMAVGGVFNPEAEIKVYSTEGFTVYQLNEEIDLNNSRFELKTKEACEELKQKIGINSILGIHLDADGKVDDIVYPTGEEGNYFTELDLASNTSFQYANGYVNGEFVLSASAVLFSTPLGDATDEKAYSVVNTSAFSDSTVHKNYKVYSVNDYLIPQADYMVIEDFGAQPVSEGSYIGVVTSTGSALDSDGNIRTSVNIFMSGRDQLYLLEEDNLLERYDIHIGDIVAIAQNGQGFITQFATRLRADRMRGSCEENVPVIIPGQQENNKNSHNSPGRLSYGIIESVSDSWVSYQTIPFNGTEKTTFIAPITGHNQPVIYDTENKTAEIATTADMLPGREIIVYTSQANMRNMIIFK